MRPYETLFIVRPDIEEEDLEKVVGRVEDVIRSNGGTALQSQVRGKRRLAYEVKKHREGIYVLINFEAPPDIAGKLQEHFRFNEDVIRDIVVQQEWEHEEQLAPSEAEKVVNKAKSEVHED